MIDKYKLAFQEEARELLSELESALLELDQKRQDPEVVGRAFRALHTIKGSGAMFGFDNIAAFAHNLETAFDRLRNGQLTATADLINLTLAAGDQIKTMLDEASGRGVVDQARTAGILELLQQLTGPDPNPDAHTATCPEVHPVAVPQVAVPQVAVPQAAGPAALARTWRIHFRPSSNALLNGVNPLLLLAELRALGELRVTLNTDSIPPLAGMDAELCYLAWDMELVTPAAAETIRDVFIFVEDESELAIEPAPHTAEPDGRFPGTHGNWRICGMGQPRRVDPPRRPGKAPLSLRQRLRSCRLRPRASPGRGCGRGRPQAVRQPLISASPPKSWTSWSTWSANWSPCRRA